MPDSSAHAAHRSAKADLVWLGSLGMGRMVFPASCLCDLERDPMKKLEDMETARIWIRPLVR